MRRKSTSKQAKEREMMETENLKEQQPHLSGAYIRSLVKQLSHNSRNKDSINTPKLVKDVTIDSNSSETQQSQPPQQHKKQVRRRLHTSRPYQERLLNMAEARKEIVTALKFHRASMKQQKQQQQQETQMEEVQHMQPTVLPDGQLRGKSKSRRNQKNHELNNKNHFESFSASNFSCYPPPYNHYNTYSVQENLVDFSLPNQGLGLNLNLQDFNNLETPVYNSSNYPSIYSSSSSLSSSSSPPISYSAESFPSMAASQEGCSSMVVDYVDIFQGEVEMHPSMDDKEIAEIRSIGDQYQMELNDTLNLASSAWWLKFLKSMEIDGSGSKTEDYYGRHPFDEIVEFPAWLNANESSLQQHLQDYYSDTALPCMDIQEIQGMDDGEWLS